MGGGHSHDHGAVYGSRDAVRAVIVSAGALGIAAAAELGAAIAGHSASVLADGLHNAGDVLTTLVLLVSFAIARRPATRRFTAGFGRIEDVATLLIVLIIVVTAALAFYESVRKFFVVETYGYVPQSLAAAAIGIVANLAVSEYKVRVGRGIHSTALEADGIHSRIDALVSAGALVGIGLAGVFGLRLADPIAGVLITVAIVYVLAGTVRDLFYRMMDAVDPELVAEMTEAAAEVPGVLAVHDVSARWVGRELWAVMHIDCDPTASLKQAHDVVEEVHHEVSHRVEVARLDVHMDPGTTAHQHGGHQPEPAPASRPQEVDGPMGTDGRS
jgi:cation diffusion facilitator family transporter